MKRVLVLLGAVFAIIGSFLFVFTFFPVSDASDWLNQSFVVPEQGHYFVHGDFYSLDVILKINFETTQGGAVDFYVMDEAEYLNFDMGLAYNYYQVPSASNVTMLNTSWTLPNYKTIYFVWDNPDLFETRTVSAVFQFEYSHAILLSPLITGIGLLLLFGGLSTICLGYRFPSPHSFRIKIIVGYFFASFGGLIGLFIGADLLSTRENAEAKFHGKIQTAISVVATVCYFLLLTRNYIL